MRWHEGRKHKKNMGECVLYVPGPVKLLSRLN